MLGAYKLSRRQRVRKVAAGVNGIAAAITGMCLLLVMDTLGGGVIGILSVMVLVGAFVRFALYGPAHRLADKLVTWWYRKPS